MSPAAADDDGAGRALGLVELVQRMDAAARGGVKAQAQWLEDAAVAIDAAQLGDEGARAAVDLRAALGAIVHWARGPKNPSTLPELEAVVRTFTARGVVSLYGALSASLDELAAHRAGNRAVCAELSQVFAGLREAQMEGRPPPRALIERLDAARRELDRPSENKER